MTLQSQLEMAAAELQASVKRQDFARASACAGRYGELLQRVARELPAAEAAQRVGEGRRRLESARRKVCVARARIGERLRTLARSAGYRTPAGKAVHTWSVQA
jgi:hypothetical protein